MLEKAELTLIKMLSKTKKVITTPPPVLCSIASCNYYFTEVEDCEYFHYYLCRQLKGGGMEIKMQDTIISKAECNLREEFDKTFLYVADDNKETIRRELEHCNISEANLFPELEYQLRYIRKHNEM